MVVVVVVVVVVVGGGCGVDGLLAIGIVVAVTVAASLQFLHCSSAVSSKLAEVR